MEVQKSTYGDSCAHKRRTPRFLVFLEIKLRKNAAHTKKHWFWGQGQGSPLTPAVFCTVSLHISHINTTFVICKASKKEEKTLKP